MKLLDLTFPDARANLACDEALLEFCEASQDGGVLRFWEPNDYFVVLGYANRVETEVNQESCRSKSIPILRRCSGGGTVLQGPGCLNYSLILKISETGPFSGISGTNRAIMAAHRDSLGSMFGRVIDIRGHTDLVFEGRKFSGNAQRRRKSFLLFHGTFLLNFDLSLMEHVLRFPSKSPAYRQRRSHLAFLTNLSVPSVKIKDALRGVWKTTEPFGHDLSNVIDQLVQTKYASDEWNLKF